MKKATSTDITLRRLKNNRSRAEEELAFHLNVARPDLPVEREFKFHPTRRWRSDFLVGKELLVEVEGTTAEFGRHQRQDGFQKDCIKYAEAMAMGYKVLRVTPKMVSDGTALMYIENVLRASPLFPPNCEMERSVTN